MGPPPANQLALPLNESTLRGCRMVSRFEKIWLKLQLKLAPPNQNTGYIPGAITILAMKIYTFFTKLNIPNSLIPCNLYVYTVSVANLFTGRPK